jgi:hypothetical protein
VLKVRFLNIISEMPKTAMITKIKFPRKTPNIKGIEPKNPFLIERFAMPRNVGPGDRIASKCVSAKSRNVIFSLYIYHIQLLYNLI